MKSSSFIKKLKLVIGAGAVLTVANFNAAALPGVLNSVVNPANSHTYYLLDTSNWTDAETVAVGLGGHLTTINDLAENNFVWDRWGTNRDLWIGLYDPVVGDGNGAAHAANFRWISGDPSTYRNWRPDEPNNVNNDYYAYILAKGLVPEGGVWNDILNDGTNPGELPIYGVVEVVPEPASACLLAVLGLVFKVWSGKRPGFGRKLE